MSISHEPTDLAELDYEPPANEIVDGVHYPSSDGVEMGEGDWHFTALTTLFGMLRQHYRRKQAYVAGDMMLYYDEGNPSAVRASDVMVILGVSSQRRPSWLTWVEGKVPDVAFEVASKSTRGEDLGPKKAVYERIGISEYFWFDPIGDPADPERPRLRGWRLVENRYVPIEPDDHGSMASEQLNLWLYLDSDLLRLLDLETHLPLKTHEEWESFGTREKRRYRKLAKSMRQRYLRRVRREVAAAEAETQRMQAHAESEQRKLRDEVDRLKAMLDRREDATDT